MDEIRATQERVDSDLAHDETGIASIADIGEQPEATTENIVKRVKSLKPRNPWKTLGIILVSIILSASIALTVFMFSNRVSVFAIHGSSMEPTLSNGDAIVLKQAEEFTRGDIIFFESPSTWPQLLSNNPTLVKRIFAGAGDTIRFDGSSFFVNEVETPLPEGYDCTAAPQVWSKTLRHNEFWAFGDNASESIDSRYMFCQGKVSDATISGNRIKDYGTIWMKF